MALTYGTFNSVFMTLIVSTHLHCMFLGNGMCLHDLKQMHNSKPMCLCEFTSVRLVIISHSCASLTPGKL